MTMGQVVGVTGYAYEKHNLNTQNEKQKACGCSSKFVKYFTKDSKRDAYCVRLTHQVRICILTKIIRRVRENL